MTQTESQLCHLLEASVGSLPEKDFPELTPSTDLVEDLSLESIQVMDFIADVEDHFDILIEVDRLASIRTVAQLAALVEEIATSSASMAEQAASVVSLLGVFSVEQKNENMPEEIKRYRPLRKDIANSDVNNEDWSEF